VYCPTQYKIVIFETLISASLLVGTEKESSVQTWFWCRRRQPSQFDSRCQVWWEMETDDRNLFMKWSLPTINCGLSVCIFVCLCVCIYCFNLAVIHSGPIIIIQNRAQSALFLLCIFELSCVFINEIEFESLCY